VADENPNDDKAPIIIIKKVKKVAGGHHGGAWKVAYADFVTAMMAFFLLLWLLSVTTSQQKQGLSDYFSPNVISSGGGGKSGILGGKTVSEEGSMENKTSKLVMKGESEESDGQKKKSDANLDREDKKSFTAVEAELKEEMKTNPDLKGLSENLRIDMTHEGLRIQIVDRQGKPMFELGKAIPLPHTIKLLEVITKVIMPLPNKLSIRGHTDALPYGKGAEYTNWELSSDRANASRRVMSKSKLPDYRLANVQGKSDRELLDKENPKAAINRRITIVLLKQSIVKADKKAMKAFRKRKEALKRKKNKPIAPKTKKREKGVIYFP